MKALITLSAVLFLSYANLYGGPPRPAPPPPPKRMPQPQVVKPAPSRVISVPKSSIRKAPPPSVRSGLSRSGLLSSPWSTNNQSKAAGRKLLVPRTGKKSTSSLSREARGVKMLRSVKPGTLTVKNSRKKPIRGSGSFFSTVGKKIFPGKYAHLGQQQAPKPGRRFAQSLRARILAENRSNHFWSLKSDKSGRTLTNAHVDHKMPRKAGGPNATGNAAVLSPKENLKKGASFNVINSIMNTLTGK